MYIMASKRNGTLYVGVTGNLPQRVESHKKHINEGFTDKYNVTRLVYAEAFDHIEEAIAAEKRIKKWNREWKLNLIEKANPNWEDLYLSMDFVHV
jgi:putative endonuclease